MNDYGIRTDFYGNKAVNRRELPMGLGRAYRENAVGDDLMPIEGRLANMELRAFTPGSEVDPVCLYNRYGQLVKQWPDDYMPDREEVREAVKNAMKMEGRRVD